DEADIIDAFAYNNLDDWRRETAGKRIDSAIKASSESPREQREFMRELVFLLRDMSLEEVSEQPDIIERAERFRKQEAEMLDVIQKYARFLSDDNLKELVIIDLAKLTRPTRVDKKLAGLLFPDAKGYVEIKPVFHQKLKSHDIAVSMSLALSMQNETHAKDVGEIMRLMNIGDGHAGAAAGVRRCESAFESRRAHEEILSEILRIWREQT
ncbi:hypothetical protein KKB28_09025, partial [bacterium]|nr:hypothetical protein [bacterium]